MSAHLSIHGAKTIEAHTLRTAGAPLRVEFVCYENVGTDSVTIFTGDQRLTDMLVEAINGAVAARKAEIAVASEAEAA